jgi:hypothetical protein
MLRKLISGLVVACLAAGMVGSALAGWDPANEQRARDAIAAFRKTDPGIDTFFKEAHAYAVFPEITKVTIGFHLGGQTYSEVIFFKDRAALDHFKSGDYEVAAGASAIALKDGVSKAAEYNNGVAIFTMGTGGLMFEASVGGQKFTFEPK